MVADFTRTDSLKMAPASGLHGDLEPCVRDGCARSYTTPRDAIPRSQLTLGSANDE